MLTAEENRTLTEVAAGTPMGELLRRYWYPIAIKSELEQEPTKWVKLLGESLVLYRDLSGNLGLIAEKCVHRRASMIYGAPEPVGLRCMYHGWVYDHTGRCLETPAEDMEGAESTFKDRVRITAYPVQELGGLIWAYLGPQPAPLLPRWELLVMENAQRSVGTVTFPCHWLQIAENNMDPVHTVFLHGLEGRRSDLGEYRPGVDPNGSLERYVDAGVKDWETHVAALRDEFRHHVVEYHEAPGVAEQHEVLAQDADRFG